MSQSAELEPVGAVRARAADGEAWVAELGGIGAGVNHKNTFAEEIELESGSGHVSFAVDVFTVTLE